MKPHKHFPSLTLLAALGTLTLASPATTDARAEYLRATLGAGVFELSRTALMTPALEHQEDLDGDCLDDATEHVLAHAYRPVFVFDSHENARRPDEPHVLYQVTPVGPVGAKNCDAPLTEIRIRYAYLFEWDGGYGPSSMCGNSHDGDNQAMTITLRSNPAGWRFELASFSHGDFRWPEGHSLWLWEGRHPTSYLSAGKHHPFFDTFYDRKDSPYSRWGCNENVDGRGVVVYPSLESPSMPRGRMNVGEPKHHDPRYFVNTLDALGYPGENAWSWKPFCGGRGRICADVSPMRSLW